VPPADEHVADLCQELLSAVTLCDRWAVHQRNAQRHPGEGQATYQLYAFGAQTSGTQVSCRITVNGDVREGHSAHG
jgi:hypothetical protein